jgi:hypothetical protein
MLVEGDVTLRTARFLAWEIAAGPNQIEERILGFKSSRSEQLHPVK